MSPDYIGTVRIRISIVILLITAAGLLIFFWCISNENEKSTIEFSLKIIGGAAAIYAAYYAGASLKQSLIRNLFQRSFELIDKLSEVDYVGVRRFIRAGIRKLSNQRQQE